MDYLKVITSIIDTLNKAGYEDEAAKIATLENAASVGSELLVSVTHKLLLFIDENSGLNKLIGKEVYQLKDFCWSIGLQVQIR